jgi:hypothetical protein
VTTTEALDRIAAIDAVLAAGTSSVTIGDRRVDYDLGALRAERDRLQGIVAATSNSRFRRVVFRGGAGL